jgi:ABC-type phosphate/phosphonate transport system substrate-binding protein
MTELMIGAVAYDQRVVPIWEGIREYYRDAPVEMDFVLFSNYEAQVDALLKGRIEIAWNTNLAYVHTHRATGGACQVLAMRDTDLDFRTLLVVVRESWRAPRTSGAGRWRSAVPTRRRPRSCRCITCPGRRSLQVRT